MPVQTDQVQGETIHLYLYSILISQCPAPPTCCESGQYALDECGCCLKCAKAELQTCGGANDISGRCGNGLQCLKTCCKLLNASSLSLTGNVLQCPVRLLVQAASPASFLLNMLEEPMTNAQPETQTTVNPGVPLRWMRVDM